MSIEISNPRDRSVKQVVHDLRTDVTLLVRQEIARAKAELKEKAGAVAKQAAFFGGAGALGYVGLFFLFATLALGLIAIGVIAWLASLIVTVVIFLGAFVLVQRARHVDKGARE